MKRRLDFVKNLRAEDANYHGDRNSCFHSGNDDEQVTISKINDMMKEKVSGSCLSLFYLHLSELV